MAIRTLNKNFKIVNIFSKIKGSRREKSNSPKDNYQYIHKSKLPTLHFQHSLPRLPIPSLKDTANRYLLALKPILPSNDYICTEKVVNEFAHDSGRGQDLQLRLQELDKEIPHSNYFCKFWLDAYLRNRQPLPINSNPVILLESDARPDYSSQVLRAANLLISSLRFMKSFRGGFLKPEILHTDPNKVDKFIFRTITGLLSPPRTTKGARLFKAYPVDMSQLRCLFNFSRLPQTLIDRLYQNEQYKHIVVMRRGHLFYFDVLDNNGDIISPNEIVTCLKHIISMTDCCLGDECPSIATGTTMDRNMWASVRKYLRECSQKNADSLHQIDSAIMVLALDAGCSSDLTCLIHSLLCGNGNNRWYDKSFNLIVDENGQAGINYEQSWGDGIAILRYINDIYKDSTKNPQVGQHTTDRGDPVAKVKKLEFCLDDNIKATINQAQWNYTNLINDVEVNTFTCDKFGIKYCQKNKLSADALMQLAIQIANHRLTGCHVSVCEPCSTALFKHGRTEVVRPVTMESKELCESINSSSPPISQKLRTMLTDCSISHEKLRDKAIMGQGFDRHLFALRALAEKQGEAMQMPDIFQDSSYEIINSNVLSTSQLSSPYVKAGTFGPCTKDGYGIGYSLLDDSLKIFVTNYKDYTCGRDFISSVAYSLDQIYNIIEYTKKK